MSVNRISFEITNACNLNCIHCLRDNSAKKQYLPIELFEKVLVQAKSYGSQIIILTGGEPMLHPGIEDMVDLIVRHGYQWYIVTNGTLLDRLGKLVSNPDWRSKLILVSVSLDGAKPETNDFIREKGNFKKVMKAMSYMKAKNIQMGFKTSLNTVNVGEMEELVNLASKIGAAFVEFSHMHPTPELIRRKMILPRERWLDVDKEVARLANIYRLRVSMCAGSRCSLAFTQCAALQMHDIHFDFDGNMSACCILPNYRGSGPEGKNDVAGNLRDKDIWDLHQRLVGMLSGVNLAKIRKIKNNSMAESDYYPCIFCLRHFGKLEWLKEMDPENEWIKEDKPKISEEIK
jgi:MoaA/NifB/PqqE/SkfB family radical SAM enzyme